MTSDLPIDTTDYTRDRTEVMRIDDIVPYWRNPRVVTDEAVNAVAESIRRFGYQQPIVVDASSVIIMGHTRYAACRRLGVTEVEVRIAASLSAMKARELRVLDNRLHEFTTWDFDQLVEELDEMDQKLMQGFFPEVIAEDPGLPETDALTGGRETANPAQSPDVAFYCPSCFHEWETAVTREQVMSGRIEVSA
jgi:hypothetical protein